MQGLAEKIFLGTKVSPLQFTFALRYFMIFESFSESMLRRTSWRSLQYKTPSCFSL